MSKVRLYGNTSGYVDLQAPDVAGDVTITLPNESGPFATETYVNAAVAAIPAIAGIGSNVVSVIKTDAFSSSSTSYTDVTGLTVTITPTSATSKILVFASATVSTDFVSNQIVRVRLVRDSTEIGGTTVGSNTGFGLIDGVSPFWNQIMRQTLGIVDAPATTAATTYHIEMKTTSDTGYINRAGENANDGGTSWLVAIEVAA
jgi:hypothetical protein